MISRNKHLPYIASYHGPWLSLPIDLLQSLFVINCDSGSKNKETSSLETLCRDEPSSPPIDPIIFKNLVSIRKLVDEASELVIKSAGTVDKDARGMSALRQHRLRELAVQKLAKAYRVDEVATSVLTMQSASALDDVAKQVLKKSPQNHDAMYVHFFHEKIPSRMLAASTTTQDLDIMIEANPDNAEYHRTRAMIRCFREEFDKSLKDFKTAIALTKKGIAEKQQLWDAAADAAIVEAGRGKRVKHTFSPMVQATITAAANACRNDPPAAAATCKRLLNLSDEPDCGSEAQVYFLRAACYHQYAISLIDKVISKVNQHTPTISSTLSPAQDVWHAPVSTYAKELEGLTAQITNLVKRSTRDYQHFLSFFPTISKLDDLAETSLDAFLTAVPSTSLVASQGDDKKKEKSHDSTYHPLLVEAWYAIGINHLLVGDWATASTWHERITRLQESVEGYPVFLPARSMAQGTFNRG